MTKKTTGFILAGMIALAYALTGCSSNSGDANDGAAQGSTAAAGTAASEGGTVQELDNTNKNSAEVDFGDTCVVNLNSPVSIDGSGASYDDGVLSITSGGIYNISGSIEDGYIYIETDENVKLLLNGVSVTNSSGAAVYCYSAKNLYIESAEGTENFLEDGSAYSFAGLNESEAENEPNAALYSKDDLILCGSGSLTVTGNYSSAVRCNDDLTVESGSVAVTSSGNGIRGSDSLVIEGGSVTVNAGKDGLKSTNSEEEGKGYVLISGGTVNVTAAEDGIQAEQELSITNGTVSVTTTGEVASGGNDMGFDNWNFGKFGGYDSGTESGDDEATSKGIKSSGAMVISGGTVTVNSTDHCVHSAGTFNMTDGTMTLSSSSGKGISSHGDLQIDGGTIDVLNSTEGVESKAMFTVNGGNISIQASDDGINSGGGSDSFGFNNTSSDGTTHDMYLNGGYIYIDAAGDGIDSNGSITVNGGTVIVNGPTSGADGAVDCGDFNNTFTVNGGILIAGGSSQMSSNPSSASSQNCICLSASLNGGSTIAVQDSKGSNTVVFTVGKQCQHIIISSPDITTGETYSVYTDVFASGESTNGLYDNSADVETGAAAYTFTVESTVTTNGSVSGGFGGMGGSQNAHGGRR